MKWRKGEKMSIKTRKFKCTGCGEDRPCTLENKQEPHSCSEMDDLFTEDLKCVLDSTNQTSIIGKRCLMML